ncbi:IMP cyclohydrolase [Candidatus Woesearchaeota archaeon]|nr:IMP cyclohydrolase [Candidatus Woesearchaeota archaeon]
MKRNAQNESILTIVRSFHFDNAAAEEFKMKAALISCYDKTGLKDFAAELIKKNPDIKIFSSSGTYAELKDAAAGSIHEVSEYIGFKEMPSGLVKTLHPKIHSGILADLNNHEHKRYLEENNIEAFDLVVVNLYPFRAAENFQEAKENIDIGGVSLLEAGAKNFTRVAVVHDREDYPRVLNGTNLAVRFELAKKAIKYLHQYFGRINAYFEQLRIEDVK